MVNRRTLLAGVVALGASAPALATGRPKRSVAPLPDDALFARNPDRYWASIRKQFLIPDDVVFLNPGTAGSSPRPVIDAVVAGLEDTERMMMPGSEQYPLWGYGPWDEFREPLAGFVGARKEQIALLRNATEANNYIVAGLDLKAGDEIITTNEEHGSLEQPLQLRAKRSGVVVKHFELPRPATSSADILERLEAAITPKTKLIFVSHISSVTGMVLPVKEIATLARTRGILCAIDGAQVPGMIQLNIEAIGCDIYTGSLHKWLFAPKGTGFLWIRDEVLNRVWVTVTTGGWDKPELKADRFMHIGTSNLPVLWGMRAAIKLAQTIGMERIEMRQRQLADYIRLAMVARGAEDWTSPDPALRCAMACVNVAPIARMELQDWLWANRRIRIRGGEPSRLRLCTPYFVSKTDIDRFLAGYDEFRKIKGIG